MKWLLQNLQQRFRFALRNPKYVIGSLLRELTRADERFLATVTGIQPARLRAFLNEPFETHAFAERLHQAKTDFSQAKVEGADLYAKKILVQYAAIRALQPDSVVETGVASGVSSFYILLALHKNGHGKLHSIELSDPHYLPPGRPSGWIVPDWLRSRWDLRFGDSTALLPELLAERGVVDVFIHDSLHTYDHMLWEFRTAHPWIRPGGLLIADDAPWNPAFSEFAAEIQATHARILHGVGFLKKNHE